MVFKPQAFYGRDVNPADLEANPTTAMETRVAEALARAADIDASDVIVTAVGATAVLQGTVSYPEEVAIAEDIASRVAGVVSVDNRLVSRISNDNGRTL
jgi:osmotically-inducible protein OsmY